MKLLKISIFVLLGTMINVGCSNEEDNTGPTITINKPSENTVFKYGNSVYINLTLEDEAGVAVYKYTLEPVNDEGIKFEHSKEFTLNSFVTSFTINHSIDVPYQYEDDVLFDDDTYRLKIIAEDFNNNVTSKEVLLTIEN